MVVLSTNAGMVWIICILILQINPLDTVLKEHIDYVTETARQKMIIDAVKKQNSEQLSLDLIKERDKEWIETGDDIPLKKSLTQNKVGRFLKYLRHRLYKENAIYNEAFLTDSLGANVACSPLTSDYWQGDEKKFVEPFRTKKVFIGPLEFDESTQKYAVQISVPVLDNEKCIGVLIVGVTLRYIEERIQSRD